jgi:hypothetical protein
LRNLRTGTSAATPGISMMRDRMVFG